MALLPTFKRVNTKDYKPENKELIEQLGLSVNDGVQPLYDALNGKLTIQQNFLGSVKDVEVNVDSTGRPYNTTYMNTGIPGSPSGLVVIQAENLTNSSVYPTSAPFVSYSTSNNGIQITNVTGLVANNSFRLRILVLG